MMLLMDDIKYIKKINNFKGATRYENNERTSYYIIKRLKSIWD